MRAAGVFRSVRMARKMCSVEMYSSLRRLASSRADAEFFQNLGNYTAGLFDKCQQDVFRIDLVMAVALDDLRSALCGLLCSFCKSVKSHHRGIILFQKDPAKVFLK